MQRSLKERGRAVTLVELLVALTVLAVISTAVTVLLTGAADAHQYVNTECDAMAQVENAYRRILHNVRAASDVLAPTDTAVGSTLSVATQMDSTYSATVAPTVTYSVVGGNLVETDDRYGTNNVLVENVKTFSVKWNGTANPTTITVTITSSSTPAVTRTATISCRNL
jgi:prepilin-type N-terminal cleavage/methylation domain-containing protein